MNDFKGWHFEGQIILWAVRWYCRNEVSHRELEEMREERGIAVDHTAISRWRQRYAPLSEKRLRWLAPATLDLLARGRDLRDGARPLVAPVPCCGQAWRHHRRPRVANPKAKVTKRFLRKALRGPRANRFALLALRQSLRRSLHHR